MSLSVAFNFWPLKRDSSTKIFKRKEEPGFIAAQVNKVFGKIPGYKSMSAGDKPAEFILATAEALTKNEKMEVVCLKKREKYSGLMAVLGPNLMSALCPMLMVNFENDDLGPTNSETVLKFRHRQIIDETVNPRNNTKVDCFYGESVDVSLSVTGATAKAVNPFAVAIRSKRHHTQKVIVNSGAALLAVEDYDDTRNLDTTYFVGQHEDKKIQLLTREQGAVGSRNSLPRKTEIKWWAKVGDVTDSGCMRGNELLRPLPSGYLFRELSNNGIDAIKNLVRDGDNAKVSICT